MVLDLRFLPLIRIIRPHLCQHPYFSLMAGLQASPIRPSDRRRTGISRRFFEKNAWESEAADYELLGDAPGGERSVRTAHDTAKMNEKFY